MVEEALNIYIYYLLLLSIYILVFKQVAEDHWWWRHQLDNSTIERCGYSSRGNASELTRMLPTCRWWRNRLSKKVCLACIYIVTLIYRCMHTHTFHSGTNGDHMPNDWDALAGVIGGLLTSPILGYH